MGEPICFGFPKKGDRRIVMFRKILVLLVEPHFFCERNPIWYEFFEDSTIFGSSSISLFFWLRNDPIFQDLEDWRDPHFRNHQCSESQKAALAQLQCEMDIGTITNRRQTMEYDFFQLPESKHKCQGCSKNILKSP